MKDMMPLRCATHPHRKSAEYGSHVRSNAKSTLYQGLRSGRRSSPAFPTRGGNWRFHSKKRQKRESDQGDTSEKLA
jgi:hypothetical protein